MKKLLIIIILVAAIYTVQAQNAYTTPGSNVKGYILPYKKFSTDTAAYHKYRLYPARQRDNEDHDGMPVAGLNSVQLTYQYNNGKGLDIYKANTDNMPVAKPDSTFYSAMPMKKYSIIISPVKNK